MDTKNTENFDWLCRACMRDIITDTTIANDHEERRWQSIDERAEEFGGTLSIVELLSSAIPQIEVHPGDDLPKKVCHSCLQQLTSVHRFQQMCIQSDQQMREMIATIYSNMKEAVSYKPAGNEDCTALVMQEILSESIEQRPEIETAETLLKKQQQTVGDPLESVRGNWEEELRNWVKNEPCDDNDEYLAKDDVQDIIHSTINVKEEKVVQPAKPNSNIVNFLNCDMCNRFFHKPESLHKHRLSHENIADTMIYSCELCKKRFNSKRKLYQHIENRHPTANIDKMADNNLACEVCTKAFTTPSALKYHQRTHTGERPYLCIECGKSFATAGGLTQHQYRHSNKRTFECPYCPLRFNCSADVTKHKITHKGIKPHMCDICGNSFCKPYQLKRHKARHTGERPYKCESCEMRFYRLWELRQHIRTHTGEKPYKCEYCERAFAQHSDLIKHLRTHLGDNVYVCSLCPADFRLASELRVHFATHKNEDEETRELNMKALKDKQTKLQLKFFNKETKAKSRECVTAES